MPAPPRSQPPPFAAVADLLHADDLPTPAWTHELPDDDAGAAGPDEKALSDADVFESAPREDPGSREPLGHRVTRRFLALCEHPRSRDRMMRMLRSSAGSAVGGRLLVAFLSRVAFRPVLRSRRIDHATARVELACAQLGGVAVLRYVTRMEPIASMPIDALVAMVGPAVDATLTAPYRDVAGNTS